MKTIRLMFNDQMARAIVEGRKTVTRRPVMPQPEGEHVDTIGGAPFRMLRWRGAWATDSYTAKTIASPGDLLIGRECWGWASWYDGASREGVEYRADGARVAMERDDDPNVRAGWRPSIHMPDWAARIRRRVVSVTVERLQAITEADAVREGFTVGDEYEVFGASTRFVATWNAVYAAKGLGWDANPWVWRIEFERENVAQESAK